MSFTPTQPFQSAIVRIYLIDSSDNQRKFLAALPRAKLQLHSRGFDCFLTTNSVADESTREVTLPNGSPAALKFVLEAIRSKKTASADQFYLNVTQFNTAQVIRIWEACQILSIEPQSAQQRLSGKLAWDLAHIKTSALDLQEAWQVFSQYGGANGLPPGFKVDPLASAIHQFCWSKVHGQYDEAEVSEILDRCRATSSLLEARVRAKLHELEQKRAVHDAHLRSNQERKERSKEKGAERAARQGRR
ncbi:hypothetical protein CERZMDRAFT_103377 [Cercospora zeae-maydis SCOH1-5]|uniref:Uncharacterized protein n=1 Tax=Cercospora zeae-maydis SCOH1-5 TaxID=717836 RepID=A0A6A6EXP4_9PEZI|nr:hypothetical protein CERZMDRAFT_103377 [Cercospora zeae-maydis SCOH1-5]